MSNHYFGLTDVGKVRDNNEDTFLVEEIKGNGQILAAVIDGVGGYEGGEVAAGIARNCIEELLKSPLKNLPESLRDSLLYTNKRIIEEKNSHRGREKMACVLTVVLADPEQNQFHYAHVGDTRLYLLRGQSLVKVSKDHSFVGFLEESKRITEQNAMRHPKRNEVNKVLGFDPNIDRQQDYIETGSSPFLPGDLLLLCSDGLTDMIGSEDITTVLTGSDNIRNKAQSLIEAANKAGGRDNVTVVLVQNPKTPKTHEATKPVAKKKTNAGVITNNNKPANRAGNTGIVWILGLLCLGLAAALAWQLFKPENRISASAETNSQSQNLPAPRRSQSEQQFLSSIQQSTDSLVLDSMAYQSGITLSDTLFINKDSFRLSGNGLVIRADSSLYGPGIFLPDNARYVVLENIVFENFQTAILAKNNALRLRNVHFRNCAMPVLYAFRFPDMSAVNGLIHDGFPFKTDSLPDNHR